MKRILVFALLLIIIAPTRIAAQLPTKLSCTLGQETIILDIDYAAKTVNGLSGTFLENQISWMYAVPNTRNVSYYLNRYTGDLQSQDYRGPNDDRRLYGKCQLVKEKLF